MYITNIFWNLGNFNNVPDALKRNLLKGNVWIVLFSHASASLGAHQGNGVSLGSSSKTPATSKGVRMERHRRGGLLMSKEKTLPAA